jgi:hypothetical protein
MASTHGCEKCKRGVSQVSRGYADGESGWPQSQRCEFCRSPAEHAGWLMMSLGLHRRRTRKLRRVPLRRHAAQTAPKGTEAEAVMERQRQHAASTGPTCIAIVGMSSSSTTTVIAPSRFASPTKKRPSSSDDSTLRYRMSGFAPPPRSRATRCFSSTRATGRAQSRPRCSGSAPSLPTRSFARYVDSTARPGDAFMMIWSIEPPSTLIAARLPKPNPSALVHPPPIHRPQFCRPRAADRKASTRQATAACE